MTSPVDKLRPPRAPWSNAPVVTGSQLLARYGRVGIVLRGYVEGRRKAAIPSCFNAQALWRHIEKLWRDTMPPVHVFPRPYTIALVDMRPDAPTDAALSGFLRRAGGLL